MASPSSRLARAVACRVALAHPHLSPSPLPSPSRPRQQCCMATCTARPRAIAGASRARTFEHPPSIGCVDGSTSTSPSPCSLSRHPHQGERPILAGFRHRAMAGAPVSSWLASVRFPDPLSHSVTCASCSPHPHEPCAHLGSHSLGRRRLAIDEHRHRAPLCVIFTAMDLLEPR